MQLKLLFAALALLVGAVRADADTFPSKPVHILVPYAPGGAVDVLARTLGQALSKSWGRLPVVENRPGAGGIIASQALTQAAPDGYTLILVASGHPLNQFIYPKLAITQVAASPLVIAVAKDSPMKGLQDILAAARAKPDALSYGMSGVGTSAHLAGELLNHMAQVKITAIPYKGGAPALTAVMSGEVPMSINPLAEVIGQVQGGTVRAVAVTTAQRSDVLPDVPSVAQSGVPGYDTAVWWGLLGPANMPADLVTKIQQDVAAALRDSTVIDYLKKTGSSPVGSTPQAFDAYMRAEADKWGPVIKNANIKAQ